MKLICNIQSVELFHRSCGPSLSISHIHNKRKLFNLTDDEAHSVAIDAIGAVHLPIDTVHLPIADRLSCMSAFDGCAIVASHGRRCFG